MKVRNLIWLLPLLAAILAACPVTTTPVTPTPAPPVTKDSLFTAENATTGGVPEGATQVSPEEFLRALNAKETVLVSDSSLAARKAAQNKQFQDDKAFLQALPTKSASVQKLLEQSANTSSFIGDNAITLANGQTVVFNGVGNQLREVVLTAQRAQSVENALSDYALSYSLLSTGLQAKLASPESLKGKSLGEVQAALQALNALLATPGASPSKVRLEPKSSQIRAQAVNPGNGTDNDGSCNAATGFYSQFWFPLKNFISPIKQQGKRGTCWAFSAVGAIESRERVQNNNPADLSEQFLVNKVKQDWDSSNTVEGYSSEKALTAAVDNGQSLPPEAAWTYNQAVHRTGNGISPTDCQGYSGTCLPTPHESAETCTTVVFTVCSYNKVTYGGPGVASSGTTQIWARGNDFNLERYREYLSQGHVILASFDVYRGFMNDVGSNGIVSNYKQTKLDNKGVESDGSYGSHAVQIVGFLSEDDLSRVITIPEGVYKPYGGGYFIIKNSWGCGAGDAGYYYVPASYVKEIFYRLSVLNFDNRRSGFWNQEQAAPDGTVAPKIAISPNAPTADLRVKSQLAQRFTISHPTAKSVNLTVTSNTDGVIYNGPWSTDTASFGQALEYTFKSQGTRTLSLVASYSSSQARASFNVNVVNTAPSLKLEYAGSADQGIEYPITALIGDINETNLNALCANTVWAVDAPDTLSGTTGCQVKVKFGKTGTRQVRVNTKDSEGSPATQTASINVLPPPANPYPKITSYGVYSREYSGANFGRLCDSVPVATGSVIDLRQTGCSFLITQRPQRYYGAISVENPSNEALTYDWALYATNPNGNETELYSSLASSDAVFNLNENLNSSLVTRNCRISVKVNAPVATRSKGPNTVWTGQCTYYAAKLN